MRILRIRIEIAGQSYGRIPFMAFIIYIYIGDGDNISIIIVGLFCGSLPVRRGLCSEFGRSDLIPPSPYVSSFVSDHIYHSVTIRSI